MCSLEPFVSVSTAKELFLEQHHFFVGQEAMVKSEAGGGIIETNGNMSAT